LAANGELIALYWNIGTVINKHSVWGNKFVENLARDIKHDFPNATGFSVRNLKYMAKFAKMFPNFEIVHAPQAQSAEIVQAAPAQIADTEIVPPVLAQITWTHNVTLLDKAKDAEIYLWYAAQTAENGWSCNILAHQIEYGLYERQVIAVKTSNYAQRLPSPLSELAEQTLKDPYIFDFIEYRKGMVERDIESGLVKNITKLLLELGTGFAFVGNQYHIEVENEDFYIDLLFYNLKLRCYVVIEIKSGDFKPEYAGKLNFYISAVDDLLKTGQDNPTIGILLCKNKKGMIAEYALRDIEKPIGVSEYHLFDTLPEKYENVLPTAADIERRIGLITKNTR
jgi:predicted nuclease of restriction endonuclease-like (RecB) superfamily